MIWKEFLEGYHAARNGQADTLEPRLDPRSDAVTERPSEPLPPPPREPVACAECAQWRGRLAAGLLEIEQLQRDIATGDVELEVRRAVIADLVSKDDETMQKIDALKSEVERLQKSRDRFQANSKRAEGERDATLERTRHLESILKFPVVKKVLLEAVHSDTRPYASASQRRVFDEMRGEVIALYESLNTAS